MKRCFSIALILALLGTVPASAACAEEVEIVSENVDAEVAEAVYAGDNGLTTEGAESLAPEQADEELPFAEALPADGEAAGEDVLAADAVQDAEAPAETSGRVQIAEPLCIGLKERYKGLASDALPKSGFSSSVTWRSSDETIVKVDAETGVITGVGKGTAIIYAVSENGDEVACEVTVKSAPSAITLDSATLILSEGMCFPLNATLPEDSASGELRYATSKKGVATVDEDGMINAVNAGSCVITIKTFNGKKARCKVQVVKAPAAIRFPAANMTVAVDQTAAIGAAALDSDGRQTAASISYVVDPGSADAGCIALDSDNGTVTGLREGEALLVAATQNGLIATCRVKVSIAPKAVKLNAGSGVIGVGEVYTGLAAETVSEDGEEVLGCAVAWSSSNAKVVAVDAATGVLTGVGTGTCTITATTFNGKQATCKVTVKKAPTAINSLKPQNGKLSVGEVGQYKLTFPKDCGGGVAFSSSDPTVASVDRAGMVIGLAPGNVTITATTYNGKTATASLIVTEADNKTVADSDDSDPHETVAGYNEGMSSAQKIEYVLSVAQSKLGKPYVYGSFGPDSFDCSGFTTYCYRQVNVELKHSAYTQGYDSSQLQVSMSELKRGDLVFFDTVADEDLSDHSGIYLGGGKFIHCSSSASKVIISDFSKAGSYYNRVFSWGRRVLQ